MKCPAVLRVLPLALASLGLQAPPAQGPPKKAAPTARPSPTPLPVLEGIVKGLDGKPIEKALVMIRPSSPGSPSTEAPLRARSDAAGRFRLELKSARPLDVRVEASGWAAQRLEKVRPGSPLTVVLGKGASIEGTVRDSQTGAPVARARVNGRDDRALDGLGLTEPDAGLVETTTDAKGQFQLAGLASGTHTVMARAGAGYGRRSGVRPGTRVEILLVPGATLFGRVTGPQGQAVAGAAVSTQREERAALPYDAPIEKTDASGQFEVAGLAAGTYSLTVHHPDFAPGVRVGLAVERDTAASADLVLERGTRVAGRVVDEAGRPLAGEVALQEVEGRDAPRSLVLLSRVQAGADGRFQLPGLASASYALVASARGLAPQRVEVTVSFPGPRVVDVGDVVLESGITIKGRVRDPSRGTVAGAEVRARPSGPPFGPWASAEAQTDGEGAFVLAGLIEGSYRVEARAPGYATGSQTAGTGSESVEIVLPAGGSITGTVVDEASQPVEGSQITLETRGRPSIFAMLSLGGPGRTSDSDGRFTIEDLGEDTYNVRASAPDLAPGLVSDVKVVPGRATDVGRIRLRRGGIVRGTVVSAGGGAVGGATVWVRAADGDRRLRPDTPSATTSSAGAFEVKGVPEGTAEVMASHPRHAPGNASVEVDPGKVAEARIVLSEGGRIEGWARRRDGAPLAGRIQVLASQGRGRGDMVPVHPNGSFVIEHVDPGEVEVFLMVGTATAMSMAMRKTVEVREGETTTVEMTSRELVLSGRVTRAGAPVPKVRVNARGFRGGSVIMATSGLGPTAPPPSTGPSRGTAITRDDGGYELMLDEPGETRLRVETLDGQTQLSSRREMIPDADAYVADFSLSGVTLTGVVIDRRTEKPVGEARVSADGREPGARYSARTGSDGRFTLEVEPGDYQVVATSEGYTNQNLEVTVGEEGLSDVRIVLAKVR